MHILRRALLAASLLALLTLPRSLRAQGRVIEFDLKTPFSEKLDLAPAKNGALLILMESDWGSVTELGEDYALWLRNITRERRGDSIAVTLDVELREGSLFEEGNLLKSRRIAVVFSSRDDWRAHGTDRLVRLIRTGEGCVRIATALGEAIYPVATAVVERLAAGIELIMPGDYESMKLEAVVVGTEVVGAAREMVGEVREGDEKKDDVKSEAHGDRPCASPGG